MRQTTGEGSSWAAAIEQAESGVAGMASGPLDIHNALVAAADEMKFDLPEFLPVNTVRAVATELSFGFLVVLGRALFWLGMPLFSHVSDLKQEMDNDHSRRH